MKVCNNSCEIYPCAVAEPDENCRLLSIPKRVREYILQFYSFSKMKHQIINIIVEAYLESLTSEPNEKLIRMKLELAEKMSNIVKNLGFGRDMLAVEIEKLIREFEEDDEHVGGEEKVKRVS